MIDEIVEWVREAGRSREKDSDRDGFLSYAHESHAVGYGLGLGFAVVAAHAGFPFVLFLVLAALGGIQIGRLAFGDARVMEEIREEPQYFLPALLVGAVIAAGIFGELALPV